MSYNYKHKRGEGKNGSVKLYFVAAHLDLSIIFSHQPNMPVFTPQAQSRPFP